MLSSCDVEESVESVVRSAPVLSYLRTGSVELAGRGGLGGLQELEAAAPARYRATVPARDRATRWL